MASQAEIIRGNINHNRQMEAERQAAAFGAPEQSEIANGIPSSSSNDAALAAHLKEMRDTNLEYARLRTEADREQMEAMAADNFRRDQANTRNVAEQAESAKASQQNADRQLGDSLALQMQALTDTFPPNWTPETLPLHQLQQLSNLRQRVQALSAATGTPGFPDGVLESGGPLAPANVLGMKPQKVSPQDAGTVTQNPDGTWTVKYQTGETFTGDAETVMRAQAAGAINTKIWARQQREIAKQAQQTAQLSVEPIQLNQQPAPAEPSQQSTIADWWAEEQAQALARQFGFSGKDELMQWGENVSRTVETVKDYNDRETAVRFMSLCPDFPETEQANAALLGIVASNGWQYTPENLQAAHLLAVRNGVYQPLTPDQIRQANGEQIQTSRAVPPPMLGGNNPELSASGSNDPYTMPMHELKKLAIRQQLESSGPNYR